jgi:ABC-type transporter Mla maintaining outer membrane lipid asymmetry ATPase subunit MlaF
MVTHDLDSLHTVCDRIAVLAEGRVITAGPIAAMLAFEHPWVQSYFHGKRSRVDGARRLSMTRPDHAATVTQSTGELAWRRAPTMS